MPIPNVQPPVFTKQQGSCLARDPENSRDHCGSCNCYSNFQLPQESQSYETRYWSPDFWSGKSGKVFSSHLLEDPHIGFQAHWLGMSSGYTAGGGVFVVGVLSPDQHSGMSDNLTVPAESSSNLDAENATAVVYINNHEGTRLISVMG